MYWYSGVLAWWPQCAGGGCGESVGLTVLGVRWEQYTLHTVGYVGGEGVVVTLDHTVGGMCDWCFRRVFSVFGVTPGRWDPICCGGVSVCPW